MLRIPVPNAPPDLAEKVETALLGQVSEIADQVCDGMLVTGVAVALKYRDGLGGPGNVGRLYRSCLPSAPCVPETGGAASRSDDIDLK